MGKPDLAVNHARELITKITQDDDGAHVTELLELVDTIADPDNTVAIEIKKQLYSLTPDFQSHFAAFMETLKVA